MGQKNSLFQTLAPEVMKDTRMLIIDHDVIRYHSLDLLLHQLQTDASGGEDGRNHFMSMKDEYMELADPSITMERRVHLMVQWVPYINIYQLYNDNLGVDDEGKYQQKIQELMADRNAYVTMTDIATRMGVIFDRKNISGCVLRYPNEPMGPMWLDQCIQFEDANLLDMRLAASIIISRRINAVMMASHDHALRLIELVRSHGYTESMTFILGPYGYNAVYNAERTKRISTLHNEVFGVMELRYNYEFGVFDPFSGIAYERRIGALDENFQGGVHHNE